MVASKPEPKNEQLLFSAEETAAMAVYSKWSKLVAYIKVMDEGGCKIAEGSGFIWDNRGHIVTNAHVVDRGESFTLTFRQSDEQLELTATLLGEDVLRDVAVLRVNEIPLSISPVLGCDGRVGQRVYVLGAPFGLACSLSVGIVSATGRELPTRKGEPPLFDVVQTDATVNRGCSGGPVLSAQGYVIGMTVAMMTTTGCFSGVGFCVPYATIRECANAIIESDGERVPPFAALGVVLAPRDTVSSLGVNDGLLVVKVRKGGPAELADIRGTKRLPGGAVELGDFLTRIGDSTVKNVEDVWRALRKHKVGDEIAVIVKRQHEGKVQLNVKLADGQDIGDDATVVKEPEPKKWARL